MVCRGSLSGSGLRTKFTTCSRTGVRPVVAAGKAFGFSSGSRRASR